MINGSLDPNGSAYRFMLWAGDGSPDFRIRIWREDAAGEHHDVHDNGVDQTIDAGNLVMHMRK